MENLTWACHVCGETRPDSCISVLSKDTSADYDLPKGSMKMNIRYCNDKQPCKDEAPNVSFAKMSKEKS
jgi:hypothetical protein